MWVSPSLAVNCLGGWVRAAAEDPRAISLQQAWGAGQMLSSLLWQEQAGLGSRPRADRWYPLLLLWGKWGSQSVVRIWCPWFKGVLQAALGHLISLAHSWSAVTCSCHPLLSNNTWAANRGLLHPLPPHCTGWAQMWFNLLETPAESEGGKGANPGNRQPSRVG